MGTTAHLLICGPDAPARLEWARQRLVGLEMRWTRFAPDSEVSRLNACPGRHNVVSADTYRLVETAVTAWHQTAGRYNPGLLHRITGLGYDRTFDAINHGVSAIKPTPRPAGAPHSEATVGDILLDPFTPAVMLPRGLGLDTGGIGKGLAGDIVADELIAGGATGAMIDIGGDVRVVGAPPETDQWPISVADPANSANSANEILRVQLPAGAVATSSRLGRRWTDADGRTVHHLLDPTTGQPIDNDIASVTVIAGQGWWAEALTKAVFVAGVETGLALLDNASGLIVDRDGNHHPTTDLEPALR